MKISVIVPAVLVICIVIVSAAYIIGQKKAESDPVVASPDGTPGDVTYVNASDTPDSSELIFIGSNNTDNIGTINYQLRYGKDKLITDAKVGLYTASQNSSDLTLLDIPGNPLYATNAYLSNPGAYSGSVYQFTNLPYGKYYLVSEKNGKIYNSSCLLQSATDGGALNHMVDDPDLQVPASANLSGGTIYGWVRHMLYYDYMPGVKVTLLKQDGADETIYTLASGSCSTLSESAPYSGFYIFECVQPGTYLLQAENNGRVHNTTPFKITGKEDTGTLRTVTSL